MTASTAASAAPFNPATCRSVALNSHGGGCCGVSHIYSFPAFYRGANQIANAEQAEMRVRYLIGKYWRDTGRRLTNRHNRLYEAVLQEKQRKEWEPVLLSIGFRLVSDWTNTNSGNRCYMYVYEMGPKNAAGAYKSPYKKEKASKIPNPFKPEVRTDVVF